MSRFNFELISFTCLDFDKLDLTLIDFSFLADEYSLVALSLFDAPRDLERIKICFYDLFFASD
jgi:hypothetical protein